jgi:hypothetical protein
LSDFLNRRSPSLAAAALAALFCLPVSLAAQPPDAWDDPVFDSEIRIHQFTFDNFFQVPDGVMEMDIDMTRVEARLGASASEESPFTVYGRGRFDSYSDDLDEAWAAGVGMAWDTDVHDADLYLEYEQDRPVFDVGDEFDRANVVRLAGEYGWRFTDDWEATVLAEARQEEFDQTSGKDNDWLSGGAALRYRGFGYAFSPEVGTAVGTRDADDPNEDMDETEYWVKIRSLPLERLYLSLRLRWRDREYSVADPARDNFGREDDRMDWTVTADLQVFEWLGVNGYYSRQDADSTKGRRVCETALGGVGLTFGW